MSEDLKELAEDYNIDNVNRPESNKNIYEAEAKLLGSLAQMSDDEFNTALPHLNAILNVEFMPVKTIVETEEEHKARMDAAWKRIEDHKVRAEETRIEVAELVKYKKQRYAKFLESPTWERVFQSIKWHINLGREKNLPRERTIRGVKYVVSNKIRRDLGVIQTITAVKSAWRKHGPPNPIKGFLKWRHLRKLKAQWKNHKAFSMKESIDVKDLSKKP